MLNRFTKATYSFSRKKINHSLLGPVAVQNRASGFVTTVHHTLMVLGVSAIGALGVMFVKPGIADHFKTFSPFSVVIPQEQDITTSQYQVRHPAGLSAISFIQEQEAPSSRNITVLPDISTSQFIKEGNKVVGITPEQQWITSWLSKRYRVATEATNMLVSAAYLTAKEIKLDPLLILAVMAIESGFNPFAESPVGAQGLMQVMSKMHHEKFQDAGGIKTALNPLINIRVGSVILKDYVTRGGSVEAGLKLYVGAAAFDNDFGYGSRVLAEYQRLKQVAAGKKVPIFFTTVNPPMPKLSQSERTITIKSSLPPSDIEPASPVTLEQPATKEDHIATL